MSDYGSASGARAPGAGWPAHRIDTGTAHPARMYDYYLGGRDNYEVDRDTAEHVLAVMPQMRQIARANREFLARAVRHLAAAGIRQFLDIGTGIPSPGNTGEIAHQAAPGARIAYVDNDPIVIAHTQALLTGAHPQSTAVIHADLREPDAILRHPDLHAVIDFGRPVALLLVAVLHFLADSDDPHAVVHRLKEALAPGSYLVLSHATGDFDPQSVTEAARVYEHASAPAVPRSWAQIAAFFDGFDALDPGLVQLPWWRPEHAVSADAEHIWMYAGVARKPLPHGAPRHRSPVRPRREQERVGDHQP